MAARCRISALTTDNRQNTFTGLRYNNDELKKTYNTTYLVLKTVMIILSKQLIYISKLTIVQKENLYKNDLKHMSEVCVCGTKKT